MRHPKHSDPPPPGQPDRDFVEQDSKDEEVTPSLVKHYLDLADQAMASDTSDDPEDGEDDSERGQVA